MTVLCLEKEEIDYVAIGITPSQLQLCAPLEERYGTARLLISVSPCLKRSYDMTFLQRVTADLNILDKNLLII